MTHLWPDGLPIEVNYDQTMTPQSFNWQAKTHLVQDIAKRWRLDEDWWRGRVWREYFKLSTQTGLLVVIYRDWISGDWFLQMLYD